MFKSIKDQVKHNFDQLSRQATLFYVEIDRDIIFEKYLDGFEDPLERQGHNCNCCKSFLRQWGGIVAILGNQVVSIWDNIDAGELYAGSVKNIQEYIHSLPITDIFLSELEKCGTDKNRDPKAEVTWTHFFIQVPKKWVNNRDIDSVRGEKRDNKNLLKGSLEKISTDALDTTLELIGQNSLYRGKESEAVLREFRKHKLLYATVPEEEKDNYCWLKSTELGPALCRIKNTSIGTLLVNLSEGMELDVAVQKFEHIVAGPNYKRPTALVSKKQIEQMEAKLDELGLKESLERRYANEADLNVNDVLFTDKSSALTDVFSDMKKDVVVNPKTFSKTEEIGINDFINNVLPTAKKIELLLENNHLPNMTTLITSQAKEAANLFKWNNNFSWSYTGGITDSIKERVKAAGGRIDGELRVSLSWHNYDDLDLHVTEPNGNKIWFRSKTSPISGGMLDVDMNAGGGQTKTPVENIIFGDRDRMREGTYLVEVNNYCQRDKTTPGFTVQIECAGEVFDFDFDKNPGHTLNKTIATFTYKKATGITFKDQPKSNIVTKEKWNVKTNQFHKVSKMMLSPNYWNGATGNKHFFFLLEGCACNDEEPRPFFNEFLRPELEEHRKAFEVLGSKIKIAPNKNQLSGVGFSETKDASVIVKVEGAFKRTLKVNF